MKIIILLSAFFIASISANETTRYAKTSELIELTHIDKWIDFVKVLKSDDEIPPFMNYAKPSKREKKVLLDLNLLDFEKGLRSNLNTHTSESELDSALKIFRNPFIVKTVTAVNYFEIIPFDFERTKQNMHPKLRPLIISLYNILGHESILIDLYKMYKLEFLQKKKAVSILQSSDDIVQDDHKENIITVEEYRNIYFQFLYTRVKDLSIPELREFIRVTRSEKSFLKVNQVLTTYIYGFVAAQVKKNDAKVKTKHQLGF